MAKLKKPMLSLEARGTIADSVTMRRSKGQTIMSRKLQRLDAHTDIQMSWRTMVELAISLWNALSAAERQVWNRLAAGKNMSGYNLFLSQALRPNPGIYLPLLGGTMQGDIVMSANRLKWVGTLLKERDTNQLQIRNLADTINASLTAGGLNTGAITFELQFDSAINTQNVDGSYTLINARDTGVGYAEVARIQSAADPYFQASKPMVLKPVATAALPATPVEGMIAWDTTVKKFKVYNGAAWEVVGASGGGGGHVTILPWAYSSIGQGTWSFLANAGQYFAGVWRNSTLANLDNLSYALSLAAGTYSLVIAVATRTDAAIMDVDIDGVEVASWDTYSNPNVLNVLKSQAGIVVAASGLKTLRIRADGRNAGSSAWGLFISSVSLYQTA